MCSFGQMMWGLPRAMVVSLPLAVGSLVGCSSPSAPQAGRAISSSPAQPSALARPAGAPLALREVSSLETPAVAARFAAVGPRYVAPALQPGRTEFTSQAELHAALAALAAAPAAPRAAGAVANVPVASLMSLGQSQAGVPLEALLLTRHGLPSPSVLARGGRPTVLLIGQQHGDEPASAEALLALAHELVRGSLRPVLDRVNVIIVPRANPDGAARRQPATANGIDLDQDHLRLRTPEAQALAQLTLDYAPWVVVDVREYAVQPRYQATLGAAQRADAQVQYATTLAQHEFVTKAAEEWFRQPLVAQLKAQGLTVEWHHRLSGEAADKAASMGGAEPHSLRNAQGLRHAVSLLAETRGGGLGPVHLQRRVHTQVTLLGSVLQSAAQHAADLARLRKFVVAEVRAQACKGPLAVQAEPTGSEYTLTLLDPVTGLDTPVLVSWQSALSLRATQVRARPCGYWLPAEQSATVARLRQLGLRVDELREGASLQGEVSGSATVPPAAKASEADRAANSFDAARGSYYVPLGQELAPLAALALEDAMAQEAAMSGNDQRTPAAVNAAESIRRVMAMPRIKRVQAL